MQCSTHFHGITPRRLAGLVAGFLLSMATLAGSLQIEPDRGAELVLRNALVIDVRTPAEIDATGLIEGAQRILHTDIDGLKAAIGADTERNVVLYCRSGRRAAMAIEALQAEGYTRLINAGGYEDLDAAIHRFPSTTTPTD